MSSPSSPPIPPRVRAFIAAVVAVAAVSVAWSWSLVSPFRDPVALATLLVLGLLSVVLRERNVGAKVTFSFLSIIVVASIALIGPAGSALVAAASTSVERGTGPVETKIFNSAMTAIHATVGGVTYLFLGGAQNLDRVSGAGPLLMQVGLPLILADVAQMVVNAVLLAGVVKISLGTPYRRFLVQIVGNTGATYIGYGVIGFLLVVLWVPADIGPFSAVLILAPLYVARWAFVQYGEEQRAHERTLSALVTAVETKDPYAAGHSARISRLAEWLAEPLGLKAQDVPALRYSAMLHDVGKVGVPTRLLRRPRSWSAEDVASLERHADDGARLIEEIEFLDDSREAIRHHHERWDGSGYPDGLAGAQIPLASRVIAVVDAFDALTTDRADRPALSTADALYEIQQRAGTWYDPDVTAALATVVARRTWPPEPSDRTAEPASYVDHDDPVVWAHVLTTAAEPRGEAHGPAQPEHSHTPVVVGPSA